MDHDLSRQEKTITDQDMKALDVTTVEPATDEAQHDAVFGDLNENGPNYRNVSLLQSVALMIKSQIGLGVLSIPSVFSTLGMVPGVICLLTIAAMTTWTDYVVGPFKLRHPEMYGIDDAGYIMFGRVGREILAVGYVLWSGMLSISIAFNAMSTHAICTAGFVAIAAVIVVMVSSIQTLSRIGILAWVGLVSILSALFIVTIAVGVQDRPAAAPTTGPWDKQVLIIGHPSFTEAISAVSSLVFAYAGTPSFFPIAAEMRNPKQYKTGLLICQAVVTAVYLTIGIVFYFYCGQYVSSPALGSAGPLLKKICYGLALPGLIMSATLLTHLPAKYLFIRFLRNSRHLAQNTLTHWITWFACVIGCAIFSYIVSSAIPIFGDLVSLVGALLGTLMSMQPLAAMWLYDNWDSGRRNPSAKWRFLTGWNVFIIVAGTFLMVAGTYGSIVTIITDFNAGNGTRPWSCADNSGSV